VTEPVVKLHAKLYRARAIEKAMALCRSEAAGEPGEAQLSRHREGKYHVVQCGGLEPAAAQELLARVADAALVFTVDPERPPL
jgi:hypothetical protein